MDVIARGDWKGEAAESVVLDFEDRNRRRIRMETVKGEDFLLDLAEPVALRTGDALKLEDGRLVEVVGTPEPLVEISGRTPEHLLQIAWHLGNRHLQVQVSGQKLRIRRDHVIIGMVQNLGGKTREIEAPFDPEGGAYATARMVRELSDNHGHDHHAHDHHGHDHHGHHHHAHDHKHGHDHRHDHGADCGCGHDHHHDHAHGHDHGHKHVDRA
jgi:urease accessory protein